MKLPYEHKVLQTGNVAGFAVVLVERFSGMGPQTPRFYTYRSREEFPGACEFGRGFFTLRTAQLDFEERYASLRDAVRGIA